MGKLAFDDYKTTILVEQIHNCSKPYVHVLPRICKKLFLCQKTSVPVLEWSFHQLLDSQSFHHFLYRERGYGYYNRWNPESQFFTLHKKSRMCWPLFIYDHLGNHHLVYVVQYTFSSVYFTTPRHYFVNSDEACPLIYAQTHGTLDIPVSQPQEPILTLYNFISCLWISASQWNWQAFLPTLSI